MSYFRKDVAKEAGVISGFVYAHIDEYYSYYVSNGMIKDPLSCCFRAKPMADMLGFVSEKKIKKSMKKLVKLGFIEDVGPKKHKIFKPLYDEKENNNRG